MLVNHTHAVSSFFCQPVQIKLSCPAHLEAAEPKMANRSVKHVDSVSLTLPRTHTHTHSSQDLHSVFRPASPCFVPRPIGADGSKEIPDTGRLQTHYTHTRAKQNLTPARYKMLKGQWKKHRREILQVFRISIFIDHAISRRILPT